MADSICSQCIKDKFLQAIIRSENIEKRCDVCEKDRPHTITSASVLEPLIRKHFQHPTTSSLFVQGNEYDWLGRNCQDLDSVVQEVLGQHFEFNNQIVDAVITAENRGEGKGEITFFGRGFKYVKSAAGDDLRLRWLCLKNELSKTRRFFSIEAKIFFDDLFSDVDGIFSADGASNNRDIVTEIPAGFLVYRARVCEGTLESMLGNPFLDSIFRDPYKEVGPPPPQLARAGRMNAEGISIFYGSTDMKTCLAELRPAIGGQSAGIALRTTNLLRMLDFTRMRTAHRTLSYFQPDFDKQLEKLAFLRILGILISQPVVPGREADYLITQVMMEYLSHVHENPFDGVLFGSAQRDDGKNVVLFAKMQQNQPIFPVIIDGPPTIHETKSIKYEHEEVKCTFDGKAVRAICDYGEALGWLG
jgi:RES domain